MPTLIDLMKAHTRKRIACCCQSVLSAPHRRPSIRADMIVRATTLAHDHIGARLCATLALSISIFVLEGLPDQVLFILAHFQARFTWN